MNAARESGPLLSIVVPVHRMVGKLDTFNGWIDLAVQQGIEVIIVHDHGDADTGNELKEIIKKYESNRILFLEGKYLGPGRARDAGKSIATGKYLNFTDSDDLPAPLELLSMCKKMGEAQKSVCIGGYSILNKDEPQSSIKITGSTFWHINMVKLIFQPGLWRFVFLKEDIKEINFGSEKMGEDQYFISQLNLEKQKVIFSKGNCYSYVRGNVSQLTRNPQKYKSLQKTIREMANLPGIKGNQFGILLLLRMELTMLIEIRSRFELREILEINRKIQVSNLQYLIFLYYFIFGILLDKYSRLISNVRRSAY